MYPLVTLTYVPSMLHLTLNTKSFTNYVMPWGRSQTMFKAMGGGGVDEMSSLLFKCGIFCQVKLSTRGKGGTIKAKNL